MQIKICGLFRQEDAVYVKEAMPDYAGFIFWDKSRRYVSKEQALYLKEMLDSNIKTVGVFVNEKPEKILRLFELGIIDIAQLHGQETEEDILRIKEASGKPIWKAVVVKEEADVVRWKNTCADLLLFDGGKGEGKSFSWELLSGIRRPFFLAGGMNTETIPMVKDLPNLYGIDISSGVETQGVKDRIKIHELVKSVRNLSI